MNPNNLQNVLNLCHATFDRGENGWANLNALVDAVDDLTPEDLNLHERMQNFQRMNGWDCQEIYHGDNFHISLLLVPAGGKIPLHDHPSMCVISRTLWGHLRYEAWDWATNYPMSGLARKNLDQMTNGASKPLVLFPRFCNLHTIHAEETGAFLDIFSPWYDERRVCTYYKLEPEVLINGEWLNKLTAIP